MCPKKGCGFKRQTNPHISGVIFSRLVNCDYNFPNYSDPLIHRANLAFDSCPNLMFEPNEPLPNLRVLTVMRCGSFDFSILPRVAPGLTRIFIENLINDDFDISGNPNLESLHAASCLRLTRIVNNPKLENVTTSRCPKLCTMYGNNISNLLTDGKSIREQLFIAISICRLYGRDVEVRMIKHILDRLKTKATTARGRVVGNHVARHIELPVAVCHLVGEYIH